MLKVWLKSIRHGRLRERGVIEMSGCGMLFLLLLLLLLILAGWSSFICADAFWLCRRLMPMSGQSWFESETRWQAGV